MKITAYDKIKSLILSMRFKTTPLGVICVYVGGLVAGAPYNSLNLFLAMLSTFFIGSSAQTINDYFDWNIDKINHPERPIPKGILKPNEMLYFSIILFLIGFIISIFINLLCVGIVVFSLVMLILYEKYLKNIGITGNITVGFISALSFTYGGAAVGNPFASLILSLMAFFIMVSRETIMETISLNREAQVRYPNCGFFYPLDKTELKDISIENNFYREGDDISDTNSPCLTLDDISREELIKLRERFLLYVKMPKTFYKYIELSEKEDEVGLQLLSYLYSIYEECIFENDGIWKSKESEDFYIAGLNNILGGINNGD